MTVETGSAQSHSRMIRSSHSGNSISGLSLTPIRFDVRFTSDETYSRNDGAFLQTAGGQSRLQMGVQAGYGAIRIKVAPQWVRYDISSTDRWYRFDSQTELRQYITRYHNFIDLPDVVDSSHTQRFLPGDSFVELRWLGLAAKLSTESQWIGPGLRSSLILTHQAEGFPHASLGTHQPIQTVIGGVEFQLMGGFPSSMSGKDPIADRLAPRPGYIKKSTSDRYLSVLAVAYQPRFLPGL